VGTEELLQVHCLLNTINALNQHQILIPIFNLIRILAVLHTIYNGSSTLTHRVVFPPHTHMPVPNLLAGIVPIL
jgi:hypothetical protein